MPVTATGTEAVPVYADVADALADSARGASVAVRFAAAPGLPTPESVHELTHRAVAAAQRWLADEGAAGTRLVAVTHGAVAADSTQDVRDLAGAAVWGLLRSAQTEHPDRVTLVDLDEATDAAPERRAAALAAAVAS
ncbi:hypothetical protein I6A84_30195, partial [Frankia sp. CNm7]|uniref:SpnB-like Rossmann fold domain-containing protein n=1 Tax=Frankia nepalensis TaxID=1836974 RepID=UPI00193400B0